MKQYKTNRYLKDAIDGLLFGKKAKIRLTKKPGKTAAGKDKLNRRLMKNQLKAEIYKNMHPRPKHRDKNGKRLVTLFSDLEPNRQRNIRNRLSGKTVTRNKRSESNKKYLKSFDMKKGA